MYEGANTLGVTISRQYLWDNLPESCYLIQEPNVNVVNVLNEEFKTWCYVQPVMIAAPTGSGKTSLVVQIAQYCHQHSPRKWVLLLVNRKAIAVQQRQIFASALASKYAKISDPDVFELFEVLDDIGVIITTYQGFAAHHDNFPLDQIEWVIFDEAHVFHADSLINAQIDQLFWKLPQLFNNAHRLYLTATPDSVIHDICEAEQCNLAACASCPRSFCCGKGKLLYYKFPSRSRHVDLRYFRDRSEITKLIKDTPQDQFLIFTSSREDILNPSNGSYSNLLSESGISYGYLDADSKGSPLWKMICKNGVFDSQVLIATSVLDCGINLVSPRLRHIIVETCEQTEFLQMIGRRRLQTDDSINVYVRAYTATAVQRLLDSVNRQRRFIQQASQMIHSGQMDKLVYNGWMDETLPRPYKHLLNYLGKGAVLPKRTAGNYLIWQRVHLERLLDLFTLYGDDSAVPRMAHKWLEQEDGYSINRWLDYDHKSQIKSELLTMLAESANTTFSKAEIQPVIKNILWLINSIQPFPHDTHSKTNRTATTVNKRLQSLHIPYEFLKAGKGSTATFTLIRNGEV